MVSRGSNAAAVEVELQRRLAAIEYAQGSIAHIAPGRNLADELIEDRRSQLNGPALTTGRDRVDAKGG